MERGEGDHEEPAGAKELKTYSGIRNQVEKKKYPFHHSYDSKVANWHSCIVPQHRMRLLEATLLPLLCCLLRQSLLLLEPNPPLSSRDDHFEATPRKRVILISSITAVFLQRDRDAGPGKEFRLKKGSFSNLHRIALSFRFVKSKYVLS